MDARFAAGAVPQLARQRRVSDGRDAVSDFGERRTGTAAAGRLGLLGELLAGWQVAGVQPPSVHLVAQALSRQLRRGHLDRRSRRQDVPAAAGRSALQPLLADVGRGQLHLLRRRPAAERLQREAGQPRSPAQRQQHLQDCRQWRPAGAGDQTYRWQPLLAIDVH